MPAAPGSWVRSSACADSNCVEVRFVRSSLCSNVSCVEVGQDGSEVLVRDSKHPDQEPLRFTAAEWAEFLAGVQAGEFRFGGEDA